MTGAEPGGLWIGVLGPLLVRRDGADIPAGSPRQRAILALAALDVLARRESLIDALWGDDPPDKAMAVVQTYVSRLRALLGPAPGGGQVLARAGSGYRLQVAEDGVDLRVFGGLAEEARRVSAAGDAAGACDAYERALALWRGDPAEDVAELRGHPAVVALTAERTAVTMEYADLASACGRHEKPLPHLRMLASRDPLDEALHARLVVALAGCGRQAEALRLYEDVRRRLDDQLAVAPGPELRAAHVKVLRQEIPVADADAGWRPVFQLPAAVADFTGRAADREPLIGAITPGEDQPGVPVAVLWGAPGVGKTALALHAAHQVRARFPDGQLWVHLAGNSARPREPGDVLGEFLRALGVPGSAIPDDVLERAACYRSRLAGHRVLVVADDAASAAQVQPLLPGTAGSAVLVTSRIQLDELAGATLLPLTVMTQPDALGLLTRLAGPDRVAADPGAATGLVRACGALPLALRIVGGRLAARPAWPIAAELRRITREHSPLRELEAGGLSVRDSIASSYRLLSDRGRRAFRRLGLLGPADFAGWVPGVLLGELDAAAVTDELVGKSLLTPVSADPCGEPRYRLHDLLRDYASERLDNETAANRQIVLDRILEAWFQLAGLAAGLLPREGYYERFSSRRSREVIPARVAREITADPVAWFAVERDNLRAAVDHACAAGRWELAAHTAPYLWCCRQFDNVREEMRLWRTIAEAARRAGDEVGAARASVRSAAGMIRAGYAADAAALLDTCIRQLQDAGQPGELANAMIWRASCFVDLGDHETGLRAVMRARALAQQAGDRPAVMHATEVASIALIRLGRHEAAIAECERTISLSAELNLVDSPYRYELAYACNAAGQHQRALDLSAAMLESAVKDGDREIEARALMVMADAYRDLGRPQDALDALTQAEPVFRAGHTGRALANCLHKQGQAHHALGSPQALPLLMESMRIFRELRVPDRAAAVQRTIDRCR